VQEDYVAIVDAQTLEPVKDVRRTRRLLVVVAARVGPSRLIDNFEWSVR
jgi:pantothenate synthetase